MVEEVFDGRVVVPVLLVFGLIVVYHSFLHSFNLPFCSLSFYFHVHLFCSCLHLSPVHPSTLYPFLSPLQIPSASCFPVFYSVYLIPLSSHFCLSHYPPRLSFLPSSSSLSLPLIRSLSQGSTNSNMLDVQGGAHKKRVRRSSLLNAKKLYEDAQMARKVKQYLSNLSVETDEEKHQIMSLQCEPSYSTCE